MNGLFKLDHLAEKCMWLCYRLINNSTMHYFLASGPTPPSFRVLCHNLSTFTFLMFPAKSAKCANLKENLYNSCCWKCLQGTFRNMFQFRVIMCKIKPLLFSITNFAEKLILKKAVKSVYHFNLKLFVKSLKALTVKAIL